MDILFNKQPVPRLTLSYVVFWNSGKATIPGEHVVEDDSIRLEIDQESDILKANVLKVSRKVTKFNLQKNQDKPYQAIVTFDYLDPGDGAVLELLHTSKHRNPKILGTIRGVPQGIRSWGTFSQFSGARLLFRPWRTSKLLFTIVVTIVGLFGLIMVVVSLLPQEAVQFIRTSLEKDTVSNEEWTFTIGKRLLTFILGLLYVTPALIISWLRRKRFPNSLQIPELDV